jgi:hypothetical protein
MGTLVKAGVGIFVVIYIIMQLMTENKEEIKTQNSSIDKEIVFQQIQVLKDKLYMAKEFKDEEQVIDLKSQIEILNKKAEAIETEQTEKKLKLKQAEANSDKLMKDAEEQYNKINNEK